MWHSHSMTVEGQTLVERWGVGSHSRGRLIWDFLLQRCVQVFCGGPLGVFTSVFACSFCPLGDCCEMLEEEKPRRGGEWLSGYTWHRRPAGRCAEKTWINVWRGEPPVKGSLLLCVGIRGKIHSEVWSSLSADTHCGFSVCRASWPRRRELTYPSLLASLCLPASLLLYFGTTGQRTEGNVKPDTGS